METPPSLPASSSQQLTGEEAVHARQPQRSGQDDNHNRVQIPEDGYKWKKYGQKRISNIQKIRSYFKCRQNECNVKKKVEWNPSDPSSLKVLYEGLHNHPPPLPEMPTSSNAMNNQYNLANQVFGPSI